MSQQGCAELEPRGQHPRILETLWAECGLCGRNLADLESEQQEEISLESFISGLKPALGVAAELAPSYSFDGEEA